MKNVFVTILAVCVVLGVGSGAARFAHLTLEHGDCAETCCGHDAGGSDGTALACSTAPADGASDQPPLSTGRDAGRTRDADPSDDDRDSTPESPATCLLCSVLVSHTLGEWPFADDLPGIGRLEIADRRLDPATPTTRPAESPARPRGPPA